MTVNKGWDSINGDCVIGGGEGTCSRRINLQDFSKQFFPHRVKLTFEGIDGRGGYNRSREPVPIFNEAC